MPDPEAEEQALVDELLEAIRELARLRTTHADPVKITQARNRVIALQDRLPPPSTP